jgi:predicted acetyltransferase
MEPSRKSIAFLFGLFAPKMEEHGGEPDGLNDYEQLEDFLRENGVEKLRVSVCDNPCGCITLHVYGADVWHHYWTTGMNC